jgi:hypothetical protein
MWNMVDIDGMFFFLFLFSFMYACRTVNGPTDFRFLLSLSRARKIVLTELFARVLPKWNVDVLLWIQGESALRLAGMLCDARFCTALKVTVVSDMTHWRLLISYQYFGRVCYLHISGGLTIVPFYQPTPRSMSFSVPQRR